MADNCRYPLDVLDFLQVIENSSSELAEIWPCEIREFWVEELLDFVIVVRILLYYVSGAVIIFGLISNSVAFLVLSCSPLNSTSLSVYLRVLAVSDNGALIFGYGVSLLRGKYDSLNEFYMKNDFACEFHKVTAEMFFLVSAWLVVALTLERWLVVRCPFGAGYNCNTRSTGYTILVLVLCLLPVALTKIWFAGFEQDSVYGHHSCVSWDNEWENAVYLYVASVLWLPLILIFVGNLGILAEIWHSARQRSNLVALEFENNSETQKLTRLLLLLSATYILLLLPIGVVETLELFWDNRRLNPSDELYIKWLKTKLTLKWARGLCFFFYQWNFAFNFFLYCMSGDKFRSAVCHWFQKCSLCERKIQFQKFSSGKSPSVTTIFRTGSISSSSLLSEVQVTIS